MLERRYDGQNGGERNCSLNILELLILVDNLDAMLIASSPRRLADGREMAVHGMRLVYISRGEIL